MRALRIASLLAATAAVCLLVLLAIAASRERLPADSDLPREQSVGGWSAAAKLARTDTFEPATLPDDAGDPKLTVRGIPGDSSRPIAAAYPGGLIVRQAHVDVDPQLEDEPAKVEGTDDAWWGTVRGQVPLLTQGRDTGDPLGRARGGVDPDGELAETRGRQR